MGEMERLVAADVRRSKINSAIIATVSVAGLLAVAAVAPNVLTLLGKTNLAGQRKQKIKSSFSKLLACGYLVLERDTKGVMRVGLTKKGEWFAVRIGEGKLIPKKPKRWDGKWRMLIFDIPESRRKSRAQVRLTLVDLGFYRLQDSVWVYPYDCEDFIVVLKIDMRLGKEVLYVIADKIENDKKLKSHFGLGA